MLVNTSKMLKGVWEDLGGDVNDILRGVAIQIALRSRGTPSFFSCPCWVTRVKLEGGDNMTAQENLFALECFPSKVRDDETHVCRRPKPDKLPQLAAGVGQDKLHPVAGDGF